MANEQIVIDPSERERIARAYFRDGYNCCQSVLLAFKDIIGLPEETIATFGSGFGGGMGRLREVCGSVSGMTFMAGIISPATCPGNMDQRTANYALVQEFAAAFRDIHGSIVCREILQLRAGQKDSPRPEARTAEYYTKRPCERVIGDAARIIAEKMSKG